MANGQGNVPMKDPVQTADGQTVNSHIAFPQFTVTLSDGTQEQVTPLLPNLSLTDQGVTKISEAQMQGILAGEAWLRAFVVKDTAPTQAAQVALVTANKKLQDDIAAGQAAIAQAQQAWQALAQIYTFDQNLYAQYIAFRQKTQAMYDAQFSYVPIGLAPGN
jgi:hypothetical protein